MKDHLGRIKNNIAFLLIIIGFLIVGYGIYQYFII